MNSNYVIYDKSEGMYVSLMVDDIMFSDTPRVVSLEVLRKLERYYKKNPERSLASMVIYEHTQLPNFKYKINDMVIVKNDNLTINNSVVKITDLYDRLDRVYEVEVVNGGQLKYWIHEDYLVEVDEDTESTHVDNSLLEFMKELDDNGYIIFVD